MTSNKNFRLHGKRVIVTGATGGLGRAMVKRLVAQYHCRVLGIGRNEAILQEQAEAFGDRFLYRVMDISDRDAWDALAVFVKESRFNADVLINNAGILPRFAPYGAYAPEEVEKALRVNVQSVLYGTQIFLPLFLQKEGTAIVNIASADALCPLAGTSVYSAGKAGVLAFSEALREEYRGRVYVPAVCPGFIRTGIMRHQQKTVSPLVSRVSMSPDRAARVLLRRIHAGHSRIVIGADAHVMSAAYRIAPVLAPRFFRFLLKVSRLELFSDL